MVFFVSKAYFSGKLICMKPTKREIEKAKEILKSEGYTIKSTDKYQVVSYKVSKRVADEFKRLAKADDSTMQELVTEALQDWIDKKKSKK